MKKAQNKQMTQRKSQKQTEETQNNTDEHHIKQNRRTSQNKQKTITEHTEDKTQKTELND